MCHLFTREIDTEREGIEIAGIKRAALAGAQGEQEQEAGNSYTLGR